MMELVLVLIAGAIFAIVVMWVIYKAMGTLIDWLIITFGNESARRDVLRSHGLRDDEGGSDAK